MMFYSWLIARRFAPHPTRLARTAAPLRYAAELLTHPFPHPRILQIHKIPRYKLVVTDKSGRFGECGFRKCCGLEMGSEKVLNPPPTHPNQIPVRPCSIHFNLDV